MSVHSDTEALTTRDLAGSVAGGRSEDLDPEPNATEAEADQGVTSSDAAAEPLLATDAGTEFQTRWTEIQGRFVDEPRGAVQEADRLVAQVMKELAEGFAQERERLESQWGRGEDISTEELRVALQRYRSFFQRLLST
jgi:hypothetical protein